MFRIYFVEAGRLRKNERGKGHMHPSLEQAVSYIEDRLNYTKTNIKNRYKNAQLVIMYYTDNYEAKIVKVINT